MLVYGPTQGQPESVPLSILLEMKKNYLAFLFNPLPYMHTLMSAFSQELSSDFFSSNQ